MIRKSIAFALALSLALLAGCVQVRDEYTLNPDGSGKVKVSRLEPAGMTLMGGGGQLNPEAEVLTVAKKLVAESKGIDAWKDVSWKIAKDGRIQVTGTAYFKDINKLAFGSKEGRARLEKLEGGKLVLVFGKGSGKAAAPIDGQAVHPYGLLPRSGRVLFLGFRALGRSRSDLALGSRTQLSSSNMATVQIGFSGSSSILTGPLHVRAPRRRFARSDRSP